MTSKVNKEFLVALTVGMLISMLSFASTFAQLPWLHQEWFFSLLASTGLAVAIPLATLLGLSIGILSSRKARRAQAELPTLFRQELPRRLPSYEFVLFIAGGKVSAWSTFTSKVVQCTYPESGRVRERMSNMRERLAAPAPEKSPTPWVLPRDVALEVGKCLEEVALFGPVRDLYLDAYSRARESGIPLYVRLGLDDVDIASLPWEYLYDSENQIPLSLDRNVLLSRCYALRALAPSIRSFDTLSILFLIADPRCDLNLVEEADQLQEVVRGIPSDIEISVHVEKATPTNLIRSLEKTRPTIVHFMGHGGLFEGKRPFLLFEHETQREGYVFDVGLLGDIIRGRLPERQRPSLIILDCCPLSFGGEVTARDAWGWVGEVSSTGRRGPSVGIVAMQDPIVNEAAKTFAREFYFNLFSRRSVARAVQETRWHFLMNQYALGNPFGTPALFLNDLDIRIGSAHGKESSMANNRFQPTPEAGRG